MSEPREDFENIHETLIEKYLEHHPTLTYEEARDATAEAAYSAYIDFYAARVDALTDAAKDAAMSGAD